MRKVVFDTVVFVRSLINPYSFCGRVVFQYFSLYRLIVSAPMVEEVLEVLHRPELTSKFRALEGLDLARVIEVIGQAEVVEASTLSDVSRDPEDNKFLGTAASAGAAYLISEDQDLRVLKTYQGTKIISCREFLDVLEELRAERENES